MKKILTLLLLTISLVSYGADTNRAGVPKIAVTDLAYKIELRRFFNYSAYSHKSLSNSNDMEQSQDNPMSYSQSSRFNNRSRSETHYSSAPGLFVYIERNELRQFVSDVKGEILKSGRFKVTQAKPYTQKNPSEEIYDVIKRIKEGYYPGADYVLFGTFSNVDIRDESNPIQATDTKANTLGLEIVAEFSLINTKTFEVRAAFSAMGEGADMKLVKGDANLIPSRSKVISQASKSLGADVIKQLLEQFDHKDLSTDSDAREQPKPDPKTEEIKIYN